VKSEFTQKFTDLANKLYDELSLDQKNRVRRYNDFRLQREKLFSSYQDFQSKLDQIQSLTFTHSTLITAISEMLEIQTTLNLRDELDRQSLALYGREDQMEAGAKNEMASAPPDSQKLMMPRSLTR
jgi:hypothetical protein